jgi:hypothetical protein
MLIATNPTYFLPFIIERTEIRSFGWSGAQRLGKLFFFSLIATPSI